MSTQTMTTSTTKVAVAAAMLIVSGAAFAAGAHCARSNTCAHLLPQQKVQRAASYGYETRTPSVNTGYGYNTSSYDTPPSRGGYGYNEIVNARVEIRNGAQYGYNMGRGRR